MRIPLTPSSIEAALPRVKPGLAKYVSLQRRYPLTDVRHDLDFRREFNGFYRVRRNRDWQDSFYDLLEEGKTRPVRFRELLEELQQRTGRCESSFASKLAATLDPSLPVIDSVVLANVGLRLPPRSAANRIELTVRVHQALSDGYAAFLATPSGAHLVEAFRREYPDNAVTTVKALDLVLWQTR